MATGCRTGSDKVRSSQYSVKSFVNHYTLFKYPEDLMLDYYENNYMQLNDRSKNNL